MNPKTSAALAALAATLAAPAVAHARAIHPDQEKSSGILAQLDLAQAQIHQQQSEIEALRTALAQQSEAIAALQKQAANTAQAVDATAAKAETATMTAEAARAQTAVESKNLETVKWASTTQLHDTMFFNESTIHQRSNGQPVPAEGTGFNIKRLYLGIDHQFSQVFSASLVTDVRNVIGSSSNGNNALNSSSSTSPVGRAFYVKNAYIQATLDPALIIRAGAAPLPWIPYVEGQYGFRHIENTEVDRVKLGNTADWGVHVLGDLAGGIVSYQVSAIDGSGYSDVNVTRYVDVEGRVSVKYAGLFAAIGGYDGHLGKSVSSSSTFLPVDHTARRLDVAAGYKSSVFTLAGEYHSARDYNSVNTVTEDTSQGFSLFGNVNFSAKWTAFGRYDRVRNVANLTKPVPVYDHYFNVGLQWEPVRIIDLALVYKREAVDNGAITTQSGTIGGSAGSNGTYDEIGIFGQFKF